MASRSLSKPERSHSPVLRTKSSSSVLNNPPKRRPSPLTDRKLAARCFSTDTVMDYTAGYREDLDGDRVQARRSAQLQQHPTIRAGDHKTRVLASDAAEAGGSRTNPARTHSRNKSQDGIIGAVGGNKEPMIPRYTKRIESNSRPDRKPVLKRMPNVSVQYDSVQYDSVVADGDDTQCAPTWNTYLYQLQQQAPKPVCIQCEYEVPNRPPQYGKEFHGTLSRQEADRLLQASDGSYLVRKSERAPDAFTLAIRFDNETKNYKLYYDGNHYVGEKRFDSIYDLVADGLIHFYIELRAADYIKKLGQDSNYDESPYMAYNMKKKRMGKSGKLDVGVNGVGAEDGSVAQDKTHSGPATDVEEYEKTHIFKVQNFNFHWCDFCANFMWGLVSQGVKCQDCGMQAHKKCSEKVPNDCMPDMKYVKRVFGGDLTTVVKAHKLTIPFVVEKCVKEIELRGLDQEGLYRLAGFHDDVELLRMAFDKDGENTDVSTNKYEDINTVCSALKLYFRLLPLPLITCECYKKLMEIIRKEDILPPEQIRQMREPLNSLPPAHFHTLKYMCGHLAKVVEHKSKNMMSAENLAIVFAPTLMRSDDTDPLASLMAAKFEQKVMELILSNHVKLLGK